MKKKEMAAKQLFQLRGIGFISIVRTLFAVARHELCP
jgi:hypothetical protein